MSLSIWNPKLILLTIYSLVTLVPFNALAQDEAPLCGETPSDILLMLDRTGSVNDTERAKEAEAAQRLVDLLLVNPRNRVAVGAFGPSQCNALSQAEILAPLSNESTELKAAITSGMAKASCGGTNLYDALQQAQNELDFGSNPNRVIILISDGDPNLPSFPGDPRQLALQIAETIKDDGIRIFSIAFDAANQSDILNRQRLATIASNQSVDDTQEMVDAEEQAQENADADDFFIAPNAADLDRVFKSIGEIILCDDADPCTADSCGNDGRCHYEITDACKAPEAHCQSEDCQPKIFQESGVVEAPLLDTPPDLQTNPAGSNMVQGGGLACSLSRIPGNVDLGMGFILLGSIFGGVLLLGRSR